MVSVKGDVMKLPLQYQISEYDCAPTTLRNALTYLYLREEIPAPLLKIIQRYTLDTYDDKGNIGGLGTSRVSMKMITNKINKYAKEKNFNIICHRYVGNILNKELFRNCLINKGCIVVRCWLDCEHYVLITDIKDNLVYIFDPYYLDDDFYKDDEEIDIDLSNPFSYNRIIPLKRLFSELKDDLCLGPVDNRECLLFNRF